MADNNKNEAPEQQIGDIQYFAKQEKVYPQRVWGVFRKLKWFAMIALLGIYYFAPFLRWDRGPHAPDQAILIDMPARRAYFFFIEIWPQEVYYLTAILIFAAIMLFFVTSMFGRVWCGYACPQTVWTDLFVWVERIVQGDRNARLRLDKSKLSFEKIWKKTLTHILWILIGVCTGGAWVLYFNDAPTIIEQAIHFELPWSVLGWVVALTGSTYLMAGFAREQVCTFMCPYARFQSAMFDEDTLIIGYDAIRGEPRGKLKKAKDGAPQGDCISCRKCVNVCPMGIDIREGLQMECIACGLCVDACDEIMEKVNKPKGLIRYDTLHNIESEDHNLRKHLHLIRPRTIYYMIIIAILGSIVALGLINRSVLELHTQHDRNPLFVMTSDGNIRNGYTIKILNKTHADREYTLTIDGIDYHNVQIQAAGDVTLDKIPVFADSVGHYRLYLTADKQTEARRVITFKISDNNDQNLKDEIETIFVSKVTQ